MNDDEGWHIVEVTTPNGERFRLAFKDDMLKIRNPYWVPVEIKVKQSEEKDEAKVNLRIKGESYPYYGM